MIDMGHGPSVVSMTIERLGVFSVIVFEWVSGTCSFTGKHLLIHRLVTFSQGVKGPLAHGFELLLLGLFQVLPVCATLGFSRHCVIVSCEYFLDKVDHFWLNLPRATAVSKVRN